jgi:ATP-binding cassette, subfamily B, bacterial
LAAREVMNGQLSVGGMLSISYMIGQLNGPVLQFIDFLQAAQDAKIAMNRLQEIHARKEEDELMPKEKSQNLQNFEITKFDKIEIRNLFFQYGGKNSPIVLRDVNFDIPRGKTTAIVGSSGSGKTTLLKLLLKFYTPQYGDIRIDGISLSEFRPELWRSYCGTVMQEGFIFSNTIEKNIALSDEDTNFEKLEWSTTAANINEHIKGLPSGYDTLIGDSGITMSTGQQQRLLIARALYKDTPILFFDEATSALDANTEKVIVNNLKEIYKNKTVVVIAHRLSTVKNADQIIVLDGGMIVEMGTHASLIERKGYYFTLVKNQLELGA